MITIDSRWEICPLGELVEVLDYKRVPVSAKERLNRRGDVPYYGAAGRVGSIDTALFDEPLLLLGEDGVQFFDPNKSKSYLIDGPAWVNNHAHVLRIGNRLERKFLNFYLNIADYEGFANGTTRLKLTQAAMRQIPVPVPPLEEQHRIVAILEDHLSRLDAAGTYLTQAFRGADTLRTVTLARLHEWPTASLASLATDAGYGTSEKCVADGPGPAVVRIPNLVDGTIDLSDEKRVAHSGVDVARSMLSEGDLLIVRTNGSLDLIGRSGVAPADIDAAFASYLIRYRLRHDLVRPQWVHAMLSTPQLRSKIEKVAASSAGQHNLSLGKLDSLAIPRPPLTEQDQLLDRFSSLNADRRRLLNAIASARARSTALRRSLLAAVFSGRLTGPSTEMSEVPEMIDA